MYEKEYVHVCINVFFFEKINDNESFKGFDEYLKDKEKNKSIVKLRNFKREEIL